MPAIKQRNSVVILRAELAPLGSPAHVTRVLSTLVREGRLVRVSKGVYAKTRINKFSGKLAPAATFETIAIQPHESGRCCTALVANEHSKTATAQARAVVSLLTHFEYAQRFLQRVEASAVVWCSAAFNVTQVGQLLQAVKVISVKNRDFQRASSHVRNAHT
ncbi:DUF6088 family protein [Paraburkholderia sp. BR13444]|uniref:DUF6088 family protein n=1 Tax=Paraburkholderia sp. BR13444 TaxID=3236997 RepID=UPI0034CDA819